MSWELFFEGLLLFIVSLIFIDAILTDGLFISAIASRIRRPETKNKENT